MRQLYPLDDSGGRAGRVPGRSGPARVSSSGGFAPGRAGVVLVTSALRPSLEVTGDDLRREGDSLARLPGTWSVFVAHQGGQTREDLLRDCRRIRRLGHRPVPHLAARRYRDARQLEETIRSLRRDSGVRESLVLAGDAEPVGSLADSLAVLDSGLLERSGFERVWFAGYPEGHPRIDAARLDRALRRKIDWAESAGIPVGVATQLAQDPEAPAAWCARQGLAARGVAVRVGRFLLARPAVLADLARVAGMPEFLRLAREAGAGEYVEGPGVREDEPAGSGRMAHYLALGALERLVGALSGPGAAGSGGGDSRAGS